MGFKGGKNPLMVVLIYYLLELGCKDGTELLDYS